MCKLLYLGLAWYSGNVFRYLTLPDILLTVRYITNEGLLPWYFITSPLAEIHLNLTLIVNKGILNLMDISLLFIVCRVILFHLMD